VKGSPSATSSRREMGMGASVPHRMPTGDTPPTRRSAPQERANETDECGSLTGGLTANCRVAALSTPSLVDADVSGLR
jgi:hypothetical protein